MKNHEIKELFQQADKQLEIREEQKKVVAARMTAELKRQRVPVISRKEVLFSQFLYMDKAFIFLYIMAVSSSIGVLFLLQQTGADRNTMIISCMIETSVISIFTVFLVDKLFFGRMAELGASCYFSTKLCAAVYMAIASGVNLAVFLLIISYAGNYLQIGLLQLGLYILTSFFLSNIVSVGILSTEIGRKNRYFLFISGVFLGIGYTIFSVFPTAFCAASLGVWGIACALLAGLFGLQVKKVFIQIGKGDILCTNYV